jgi:acyl-[acyl-carrier-protein] desaturase
VVAMVNEQQLYREYMDFFERAERKRRWSVFDDIPWAEWDPQWASPERALCAETFCGVEMYLPDYVANGLNVVHDSFGQAWFQANWGYEESKHALALREYLVRTQQRSGEDMESYARDILSRRWELPFEGARRMTAYGALQERTTWMIYRKQMAAAEVAGDVVLAAIYRYISRDEAAHATFYHRVLTLCLQEDRVGTLRDICAVVGAFKMPAADLVPDYAARVAVMRSYGIDRSVFLTEAFFPTLNRLGITRRELVAARARSDAPSALS